MFCPICKKETDGNFCSHCGTSLLGSTPTPAQVRGAARVSKVPVQSSPTPWMLTDSLHELIQSANVRNLIGFYAVQAGEPMGLSTFLEECDLLLKPLAGQAYLEIVASVIVPIYGRLGIKSGRNRQFAVNHSAGTVLVAILCHLARKSWHVTAIYQCKDGWVFEVNIPARKDSREGTFVVGAFSSQGQACINAGISLKNQLIDWGYGKKQLLEFEEKVSAIAQQLAGSQAPTEL